MPPVRVALRQKITLRWQVKNRPKDEVSHVTKLPFFTHKLEKERERERERDSGVTC